MKKKLVIGIVAAAILAGGGYYFLNNKPAENQVTLLDELYDEVSVTKQTIMQTISGTGTLKPADSYAAKSLVTGEVLKADFEEGDYIEKDSLLYTIDSSDAKKSIEQAELSLRQSQTNYNRALDGLNKLKIYADKSGVVTSLNVSVGDNIAAGQTIASVKDNARMLLAIPFVSTDADQMWVGESAVVTLDGTQDALNGVVSEIASATTVGAGNSILKMVKITVNNPGSISETSKAFAKVANFASADKGKFELSENDVITAKYSGEIASLQIAENGWVSKGDLVITLSDKSIQQTITDASYGIESAQMTVDSQADTLDKYRIESPISGTVVEKNIKQGDTLSEATTLCTIFDLSYLKAVLFVDELEISKAKVGQTVEITADALSEQMYSGKVTKININGVTSNGVTSYPVTIQLDEVGNLLPGMNVNMKIIVDQQKDAMAIPIAALQRGNKVLIKSDTADAEMETGESSESDEASESKETSESGEAPSMMSEPGTKLVDVKIGISDDDYVQIISGITEEDIILLPKGTSHGADAAGAPNSSGGQ